MSVRARPQSADAASRRNNRFASLDLGLDLHHMPSEGREGEEIEMGRSPRPLHSPRFITGNSPVAGGFSSKRSGSTGSYYNQHLFNRLHLDAALKRKKLDIKRANFDRDIQESMIFRSNSSINGNNSERDRYGYMNPETRMHESGQAWAKTRDSRIASMRDSKQAEEEKKEKAEHTFQPFLHSRIDKQPKRYETRGEVFEALYESRNHYNKRAMERKWIQASGQADSDLYFSPRSFAPKSADLAQKYRKEREDKIMSAIGNFTAKLNHSVGGGGGGREEEVGLLNSGRMSLKEFNNSKNNADFQKQLSVNTVHIQVSDEDVNNDNAPRGEGGIIADLNAAAAAAVYGRDGAGSEDGRSYGRSRSPSVGSVGGGHSVSGRSAVSLLTTSSRGGVRRYNNAYSRSNYSNQRYSDRSSFGDGYSIPSQPQTIHDSLYLEARIDSASKIQKFRNSVGASSELTHNPNIGVNHFVMTEVDRDSFFQRLYDHRHVVERVRQMNDREFYKAAMGRNPDLDRKLTKEDEKRVVDKFAIQEVTNREMRQRLLRERIDKEYQRAVYSSAPHHLDMMSVSSSQSSLFNRSSLLRGSVDDSNISSSISASITSLTGTGIKRSVSAQRSLTDKKSEKIAQVSRRRALCELFEILKMTEDYRRHSNNNNNNNNNSKSEGSNSSNIDQLEASLNTMTAVNSNHTNININNNNNKSSVGEEKTSPEDGKIIRGGKVNSSGSSSSSSDKLLDDSSTSAIPSIKTGGAVAGATTDGSLLDPCLAQAHMIKPAALAEVISSLLKSVAPNKLTLQSFIQLVEAYIAKPSNRPISVYLTAPTKKYHNDNVYRIGTGNAKTVDDSSTLDCDIRSIRSDSAINVNGSSRDDNSSARSRSRSRDRPHSRDRFSNRDRVERDYDAHLRTNTLSTDDRRALEMKKKPDLRARLVTERLVYDRYKGRRLGQQNVEDSLRNYQIIREGHLDVLRRQADAAELKECTFTPRLASRDTFRPMSVRRGSPFRRNKTDNDSNRNHVNMTT